MAVQTVANDLQPNFVTANQAGNGCLSSSARTTGSANGAEQRHHPVVLSPEAEASYRYRTQGGLRRPGLAPYSVECLGLFVNKALTQVTEPATIEEMVEAGTAWCPTRSLSGGRRERTIPTTWSDLHRSRRLLVPERTRWLVQLQGPRHRTGGINRGCGEIGSASLESLKESVTAVTISLFHRQRNLSHLRTVGPGGHQESRVSVLSPRSRFQGRSQEARPVPS